MIVAWAAWEAIAWAAAEGFLAFPDLDDDFLTGIACVLLIEFDEIDECGVLNIV